MKTGEGCLVKHFLFLILGLLITQNSLADESLICFAGIKNGKISTTVELSTGEFGNKIYSGALPTAKGALQFLVEKRKTDFIYSAAIKDPESIIFMQVVPSVPSIQSKKIGTDQEVFIDCKPYSIAEYCRTHTC
jgi:hypothetical protein